jgi:hypothetical protein
MYLALHVELATVFCFRTAQDTIPDPSEKQQPEIDRRVSRQAAQFKSVKLWSRTSQGPPR